MEANPILQQKITVNPFQYSCWVGKLFIQIQPVKVGIPKFLNGVGKGVQQHVEKLKSEFGDLQKLPVVRTIKLKRIGLKCQENPFVKLSSPPIMPLVFKDQPVNFCGEHQVFVVTV